MVVYVAAAACMLFYLGMIPVKFAIVFQTKPQPQLHTGTAAFESRFALRRALRFRKKKGTALLRTLPLSPILRTARYLLRHVHFEELLAQGIVSSQDAAQTALLCGAGSAIQSACAALGGRVRIDLAPDFSARGCELELRGIFFLRLGHIIAAALIFALIFIKERFEKWKTSIPLKTLCTPPWKASAT